MKRTKAPKSIASPEDQKVTFVELFFDLVFVFSVTQIVKLLHDGFDWIAVGQAILVFWLVWWAWSQFTWTLNAADTTNPIVQISVLAATGIAFFIAVAVPQAFGEGSFWFAATYVVVRVIGLTLYYLLAMENPALKAPLRTWVVTSSGGLIAVLIGGYVGGSAQYWLWGLAILLDLIAASVSTQSQEWNLYPAHFAERHGLFVIIALGETLIVGASGFSDTELTNELLVVAILVVAITCGLWWTYFPRAMPALERALASSRGTDQSRIARDSYSFVHFLMLVGVVAYAAAIEEAIAHASSILEPAATFALVLGMVLFVGGMAAALWRATGILPRGRLAVVLVAGVVIIAATGSSVILILGVALVATIAIALIERRPGTPIMSDL